MPVQSFGHSAYWNKDTVGPPPPVGAGPAGGYPSWQGGSSAASLLGGLQPWWDRLVWNVRTLRRFVRLDGERRAVIVKVLDLIEHAGYLQAQRAASDTAVTLGFNRPEAWKPYSHMLKADHRRAENLFRHVRACEQVKAAHPMLSNPDLNLLAELGYHGFCWRHR